MIPEEVDKLNQKIKELNNAIAHLNKRIEKLEEENRQVIDEKKRIEKEKRHVEKEKKRLQDEFKKSLMPLGAPKGHKGYTRHVPERIDYIKDLITDRCPHCNTKLGETQEIRQRHVTDIRLISDVKTTRYNIHRKYCPKCRKLVEPEVRDALPHAMFGLNLMLLVMYLRLGLRLSCNKIREYFMDMFSLKMCEGEIIGILRQLVVAFGDYYSYLEKIVKLARIKHSDTTSWHINGRNYVAWVFIACGIVLYKIRKSNSHKAGLAFLKKQIGNTLVVDRYAAFRLLAKKAGFLLQLCWSHILQDSKQLAEAFGAEGKYVHKKLKEIYDLAKGLNHKGTSEMVEQLKAEVFQLTLRNYKPVQ